MTSTLQTRIVEAASAITQSEGWSAVTMARLAADVGVSRQTVYNEVGGKDALAEAMVLAELDRFLSAVDAEFTGSDDVVDAVRQASRRVLEMAAENPLLRAVVLTSTHGEGTELLPLLTTHSELLLETASSVIRGHLKGFDLSLTEQRLDAAIDMVVRLVLSHVMQPTQTPRRTADDIAWVTGAVLGK